MAYIALYRKYRSQSFGELMGQEAVTTTLQNALKSGRIAHAFLFHGARGCGKTSTARLVARALNCIAQDGPTPEPCGKCRLCLAIRDGSCMDVVEMDAASETGIDDVREKIIENVQYAPGEARYKVYIIDEVHDLSAKAFDALLKTIEEPPPHVVFILATTEFHKVPITIRSRCQPYQFKRGTLKDLAASVQMVITAEGYTAEPEAVQSVARAAEGSWRDALSLLEQVISYSDTHITADSVQRALGTVGSETLGRVVETIARSDWNETLAIAGELVDSGKDVRQLLTALQGYLRDLMLIASGAKQAAAQELGAERLAQLTPQAALFTPRTLLTMTGILAAAEKETRFSNQHRWLLERTLCLLQPDCLPTASSAVQSVNAAPVRAQPVRPRLEPTALAQEPSVVPRPPAPAATQAYAAAPDEDSDLEAEEPEETFVLPSVSAAPPPSAFEPPPGVEKKSVPAPAPDRTERNGGEPPPSQPSTDRFADDVSLTVIQRAWPRILKLFEKASPSGAPFLKKAEVVGLEGMFVILAFSDSYARDRIHNNEKGRAKVEQVLNEGLNSNGYKIRCILEGDLGVAASPTSSAPMRPAGSAYTPPPPPETLTLLDAPISAPKPGSGRIADFEMPSAPSPSPTVTAAESVVKPAETAPAAKKPEPPPPPETSFLTETLNIFGGEVISTEPM